jgi:ABC-type Na+ efflux pump permease subunit
LKNRPKRPVSRSGKGWVGPLLGWELLRLGRRGTPVAVRVLVAGLLLAVLYVVYQARFPAAELLDNLSVAQVSKGLAEFAESFGLVFMLAQLGVICLLTPIFVAGSIVEEKDRRTLEFLLATDLTSREIILGKYLSRVFQMSLVLLAGLPVVAITQVWGGVDLALLTGGYVIALFTILAVGGISAAFAVGAPSLRRALAPSYVVLAVLYCGLFGLNLSQGTPPVQSPFHVLAFWMEELGRPEWDIFITHLFIQVWLAALGMWFAMHRMRSSALTTSVTSKRRATARADRRIRPGGSKAASTLARETRHWSDPPPVAHRPLWWKERYFGGGTSRFLRLLALVPAWLWVAVVTTAAMVVLATWPGEHVHQRANQMARLGGLGLLGILVMAVGLSCAGSVPKERQQQTLTDLLMVPRTRRDILGAKWYAGLFRGFGVAWGIVALLIFGVLSEGLSLVAVPLLLLAVAVYAAFAASLGLYLGVRCQTVMRASNLWMLCALLILGGTYLAAEALEPPEARPTPFAGRPLRDADQSIWDRVLHPVYTWQQLAFIWDAPETGSWGYGYYRERQWGLLDIHQYRELLPALGGLVFYALLAWLLWRGAVFRFRREGRR